MLPVLDPELPDVQSYLADKLPLIETEVAFVTSLNQWVLRFKVNATDWSWVSHHEDGWSDEADELWDEETDERVDFSTEQMGLEIAWTIAMRLLDDEWRDGDMPAEFLPLFAQIAEYMVGLRNGDAGDLLRDFSDWRLVLLRGRIQDRQRSQRWTTKPSVVE